MIAKVLKVKCLTNLHVGNGDENFDIIDNAVERDPVTNYPTINSSGVKGAFREAMSQFLCPELIDEVFGGKGDGKPGKVKFLSANLLARPMRASKGSSPYYMVTTEKAVSIYNELTSSLLCNTSPLSAEKEDNKKETEGIVCPVTKGLSPFGIDDALVMDDETYRNIALPVIARNKLDNGESKQLWYEEIVPHESVFYTIVIGNDEKTLNIFINALNDINNIVQFGGNASVGYGLCRVTVTEG